MNHFCWLEKVPLFVAVLSLVKATAIRSLEKVPLFVQVLSSLEIGRKGKAAASTASALRCDEDRFYRGPFVHAEPGASAYITATMVYGFLGCW